MFIEKCDIQNLSSIGAAYEKHRTTCRSDGACLWHNGLSINISLLTEFFTVFFQKTKLLQDLYFLVYLYQFIAIMA